MQTLENAAENFALFAFASLHCCLQRVNAALISIFTGWNRKIIFPSRRSRFSVGDIAFPPAGLAFGGLIRDMV